MPLNADAERLIRANLEQIQRGERVRIVTIGELTDKQLEALNRARDQRNLPPVHKEVVFLGRHLYTSRIAGDGYSIEEVIEQITSAMRDDSVINSHPKMNALINKIGRKDATGNVVKDKAVLECTSRSPKIELLSVVPEGDGRAPRH